MAGIWISSDARVLPFRGVGPSLGERVFLAAGAVVVGDVVMGAECSVWFNTVVRGDVHRIRIGARTNLQDAVVVHVTAREHPTSIGERVTVGHSAVIHGCTLEDGCLIGMGAKILDGARVGEGALVGAGSVVSPGSVIPPNVLALGAPARVVRPLGTEEVRRVALASDLYVGYADEYVREAGSGTDPRGAGVTRGE